MNYVTGDIHGRKDIWINKIEPVLKDSDRIIVCGDFGIGFFSDEELFFDYISEQKYTVLFVDGNHENFDKLRNSYPVALWNGGRVHKIRPNLIHLMRGEVYMIDGKLLFAFGGGYSIDKACREKDISWWQEEMPSEKEYDNAKLNLEKADYKVDYIITHTAPSETISYLSTMRECERKNNPPQESPLNVFFDYIEENVTYRHWFFGHFHEDIQLWRRQTVIYNTIRELESGRKIHIK